MSALRRCLLAATAVLVVLSSLEAHALGTIPGHASPLLSDTTSPMGQLALGLHVDGAHEALAFLVGEDQLDSTGFSRGATGNLLGVAASARFGLLDPLELALEGGWRYYDISYEGVHTEHARLDARLRLYRGEGLIPSVVLFAGAEGTYARGLVFAPLSIAVGRLIIHLRPDTRLDFGDVGELALQGGAVTGVRLGPVAARLSARVVGAWVHSYDAPSPDIIDRLDGIFDHREQSLHLGAEVECKIVGGLSAAAGYEYIRVDREGLDFRQQDAPVDDNHVLGASVRYALSEQLAVSAAGTIYWHNLTGEVPLFYNELNASEFRHHYGALHLGFEWTTGLL